MQTELNQMMLQSSAANAQRSVDTGKSLSQTDSYAINFEQLNDFDEFDNAMF